ncbi:hypothetical protein RZS08_48685, partial [Arthrospira platensis SPKY1]|nr:hypothetical protein [Arthrospira platensis SPKY1]
KQTKLNQRGVARPGNSWVFHAYLDQSLERRPELDQIARYGWTCRSKPAGFTCPAWIVPGDNGEFIEDETELFHIHVPPEFMELCDHFGMDIEAVLYGFIADAAGLRNWACCPR